jgi:hypothetical protein
MSSRALKARLAPKITLPSKKEEENNNDSDNSDKDSIPNLNPFELVLF